MCNKSQTHLESWPKSADYAFHLILHQVTHKHVLDMVTEWKLRNKTNEYNTHAYMVNKKSVYMPTFWEQESYFAVIYPQPVCFEAL
jgi:hypothetical protein